MIIYIYSIIKKQVDETKKHRGDKSSYNESMNTYNSSLFTGCDKDYLNK